MIDDNVKIWLRFVIAISPIFIVAWISITSIVFPVFDTIELTKFELVQKRKMLGQIEAKTSVELKAAENWNINYTTQEWVGESMAVIGANFQTMIQDLARQNKINLTSIAPVRSDPYPEFNTVGLRIEAGGGIIPLSQMITSLENHQPFILIHTIELRPHQTPWDVPADTILPLSALIEVFAPVGQKEEDENQ